MAGRLILSVVSPSLDANGAVAAGSTLTVYNNLTTDLVSIYDAPDFLTALANPLTTDAAGRFPEIWVADGVYSIKWSVVGETPITYDNIATAIAGDGSSDPSVEIGFPAGISLLYALFTSTRTPNANPHALDFFYNNTFVPTLDTQGVNFTSVTYDSKTYGKYVQIKNWVIGIARVLTDSVTVGGATSNVVLANLPETCAADATLAPAAVGYAADWAGEKPIHAAVIGGTKTIALYYRTAVDGNDTPTAVADVGTGANANDIVVFFAYPISE